MGPPKSFKTGAVVGTYPKPMLYLGFDREGISVIPPKGVTPGPGELKLDVTYDEIRHAKPGELPSFLHTSDQPRVLAVDYTTGGTMDMELDFRPAKMSQPFMAFVQDYNQASAFIRSGKALPWRTVVFDSITGYEDILLNHISSYNPAAMADARQWAGQVGGKVRQTILTLTSWPCHIVFIMHSMIEKNETTGMVLELPSVYSSLRTDMGGLFSQFFYAVKSNGVPKIWPHDKMFVRGIGARWPSGLPAEMNPDFSSIYGKEGLTV
jgi:hypothetical protein